MQMRRNSKMTRVATGRQGHIMTLLALATLAVSLGSACDPTGVKRNSKLSRSYYLLGRDYLSKKQPELAKTELVKALKHDPDNADAHGLLGTIYFFEGVHATNYIDRRQCIKGDAAKDQQQEANTAFREAEKHLGRVVKTAEKQEKVESNALNFLANIALHFQRYDDAIALCGKALDNIMNRNRYLALGTRGQAYFKKGKLKLAARDLRQSLFHQPKFCLGRYWLAKVYYSRKQYDQAVTELKKVTTDAKCPLQEAFQLLGLCYLKQRKPQEARTLFEQCVARNPKSCISQECTRYAKLI